MNDQPFRLVFVCTGNRFRSPLAAALFSEATDGMPIEISSVGTLELAASRALPEAQEAALRFGVNLTEHRSRSLAEAPLHDADLVIGFERMHVATAVVDGRAQRDRTFTLPELAGLLARTESSRSSASESSTPVARARAKIRRAAAVRPPNDPKLLSIPELADPLGRAADEQREIAEQLRELTLQVHRSLFG
jgi:low molecular weight protein-tyrosine phosphatase